MDALALEATSTKKPANGVPAPAPAKRKPAKKTKKAVVFFEVEILDAKTKDKLCFLDKVRTFCMCLFSLDFCSNISSAKSILQLYVAVLCVS